MIFWPFVCDVVKIPLLGVKNQWIFRLKSGICVKYQYLAIFSENLSLLMLSVIWMMQMPFVSLNSMLSQSLMSFSLINVPLMLKILTLRNDSLLFSIITLLSLGLLMILQFLLSKFSMMFSVEKFHFSRLLKNTSLAIDCNSSAFASSICLS